MPPSSTISSKGQITLPLEIRNRLGVKEGDRVEFIVENGATIIRPARGGDNPFQKYVGILPAFENKKEIDQWVAGLRDEDED